MKEEKEKTEDKTTEEASSRLAQIFVDIIDKKEEEKLEGKLKNDKND